ncbi:formin-like protein 2 isoform X3 [Apostichopus japonicus]|uniref:formin-like protein 2 isoform X3 n=1 Tax=Stichopus japonicus TaxID=307972 RepID=UPI003AB2AE9D
MSSSGQSTPRSTARSFSQPASTASTASASSSTSSSPASDRRSAASLPELTKEQQAFIMAHDDPRYYVQQLVNHIESSSGTKQKDTKKVKRELAPLRSLMEGLKQYLTNSEFVESFISSENRGVDILGKFLGDTRTHLKNAESQPTSDKRQKTLPLSPRTMKDEVDAVNCLRKITESENGVKLIVSTPHVLENVALSMISKSLSSRLYTFVILIRACDSLSGNKRILEVLSYVKQQIREKVRFHAITQMILKESHRVELTALCLRFLNTILATTSDLNQRVYLQYELELAEFSTSKVEMNYGSEIPKSVRQELDFWHSHYLSIQSLQEALSAHKSRNELLRQEVDRQQDKLWNYDHEKSDFKEKIREITDKSEEYKGRVLELQTAMEKMSTMYKQKTGIKPETQLSTFNYLMKPLDETPSETTDDEQTETESESGSESITAPPAPPMAPAPPPVPGSKSRRKLPIVPGAPLPMLNWLPIHSTGKTVFKELNDEKIYKELDFTDFEETFRLKDYKSSNKMQEKFQRLREKHSKRISLVATDRARNLIITLRKIPLTVKGLMEHINHCDRRDMPEESAELLLNFLPTKQELKLLAENADQYKTLGEAEQYMFQLARLDRYEAKLRLMAFMGIYDELIASLRPEIMYLTISSKSVCSNSKLKKIFELILAFGNYMNSSRRGSAYGFRLDSLERLTFVKSTNRDLTFVHYLVATVARCYPECKDWYSDLKIDNVRTTSMDSLMMDIQGLRKGLELAKSERDRQPDNTIIGEFSRQASDTISEIAEGFRKAEEHYHHACSLYGENYKTIEPVDFFKKFTAFSTEYQKAEADNEKSKLQMRPTRLTKDGPTSPRRANKDQLNFFAGSSTDPGRLLEEDDGGKAKLTNGGTHQVGSQQRDSDYTKGRHGPTEVNNGFFSLTNRSPHKSPVNRVNGGPKVKVQNGINR